jgi:hypothetical protein
MTFLMDFDGFAPTLRLVNGMVIVDSLTLLDRLEAESADSFVTVNRKRLSFHVSINDRAPAKSREGGM